VKSTGEPFMSDQSDKNNPTEPTVITLVLPTEPSKPATVTVRNGELGHMSTFHYDGFKDICVALNEGMTAFVGVQANPPKDIQSATPKVTSKKKKPKKQKAAGKAPYTLVDASGATRTLNKMFDPFELQDKYHKTNPKFKFKELDEAIAVAHVLIEAGLEKQITITYSNGKSAKILPETEDDDPIEQPPPDADDDYPDDNSDSDVDSASAEASASETNTETSDADDLPVNKEKTADTSTLDTDAKRAMFAVLDDEALVLAIYNDIQNKKKHGWKTYLMKQREVKGFIAVHVDGKDDLVEQLYQIALDSVEFDDAVDASNSSDIAPAPVIRVLTSPEKAKRDGVPETNEFTLATDDDDDSDSPTSNPSDIDSEDDDSVVNPSENEGQPALL